VAGRIPQEFINEVIERSDIVDIIGSRTSVKKAGTSYKACCPFHHEKTPSFHISPQKQVYHCFGCGVSGNVVTFIMEFDRLNFPEAIEELALQLGMEVPREQGQSKEPSNAPLYDLLAKASQFYQKQLKSHPEASQAIEYLQQRGLTGDIATRFAVGYAPSGWHNVKGCMPSATPQQLLDSGLQTRNEKGNQYDRFRERIMFPIRDRRGRYIGFGGRVIGKGEPKYLNSPETPVFHKGKELYGFYEAMQADRNLDWVLVVEGYMDVISLAQFGLNNAVATLGTATSGEHIQQLFKQINRIVFCFDGDRAGKQAAWRAMEASLPQLRQGKLVQFVFLPEGEDPDTWVREKGAADFTQYIDEHAQSLAEFMFATVEQQIPLNSMENKANFVATAKGLIEKINEPVLNDFLISELEKKVQVTLRKVEQTQAKIQPQRKATRLVMTPMRKLIALLIQYPKLSPIAEPLNSLGEIGLPGGELLTDILETLRVSPNITTATLIEKWRNTSFEQAVWKLANWTPEIKEEEVEAEFTGYVSYLLSQAQAARFEQLKNLSRQRQLSEEEKNELKALMVQVNKKIPGEKL